MRPCDFEIWPYLLKSREKFLESFVYALGTRPGYDTDRVQSVMLPPRGMNALQDVEPVDAND